MTERSSSPPDGPVDLDVLRADDRLLDALGRGECGAADDGIATLLAAWRADLAEEPAADGAERPDEAPVAEVVPITQVPRWRRAGLGVAAAVFAVVAGGTGIAAAQATPGSPLWPITHVLNPDRANVLDAESAIADARKAANAGRRADAQRLVDSAATLVSKVRDPGDAARLRAELDDVRHRLATVNAPAPPGSPAHGRSPAPGATPAPGSGPGGGQNGGQPAPTPGPTGGTTPPLLPPLLPPLPLPPLPLPSLPLPLPTPSLPLPLPSLTILGR